MEEKKHCELVLKIKTAIDALNDVEKYMDDMPTKQQDIDFRLSDLDHFIQNNKRFIKENGKVKGLHMLLERIGDDRITRENYNIEFEIKKAFNTHRMKLSCPSARELFMREIYKAEKSRNNQYRYRVYNEEDLKEIVQKK